MAKDEFAFRGKALDELIKMSTDEFAKLCNSRARRNLKKGLDKRLLKKLDKARNDPKAKPVRTHQRDLIIIPQMVGVRMAVHRGNSFETVDVSAKMLGHYIGEFALTRKKLQHGKAGIGATKSSSAITARG